MSYSEINAYSKSASLAAVNAAHTVIVGDAASILFCIFSVASASGITFVAEGQLSDDGPWVTAHLMPTPDLTPGTPIAVTPAISTLPTSGWRVDAQGFANVRFRMSARVGGSVVVESRLSNKTYA
jgi:hypothetical protein